MKVKFGAASAIVLTPAILLARPYECPYFYRMPFSGGGFFMVIITVLVIALIIFMLIQYNRNRNNTGTFFQQNAENPLEILNKRLANGEITEEEYDRLRTKISG